MCNARRIHVYVRSRKTYVSLAVLWFHRRVISNKIIVILRGGHSKQDQILQLKYREMCRFLSVPQALFTMPPRNSVRVPVTLKKNAKTNTLQKTKPYAEGGRGRGLISCLPLTTHIFRDGVFPKEEGTPNSKAKATVKTIMKNVFFFFY